MQTVAERTLEQTPPNELTEGSLCRDRGLQWFVPAAHDMLQEPSRWQRMKWSGARLAFHAYVAFSLLSVVGGFLSAPLMTQLFFGDWRFWRYLRAGASLFPHGWKLFALVLRGEGSFMLGVPLGSAPQSAPRRGVAELSPSWSHGTSCGSCRRCCHVKSLRCPVLDIDSGFCRGYNSFYWRYFNCGRYPSSQSEIDYYGCPKWQMKPAAILVSDKESAA